MSAADCNIKVGAFLKELKRDIPEQERRSIAVKLAEMRAENLSDNEFKKAAANLIEESITRWAKVKRAAAALDLKAELKLARGAVQKVEGMSPLETALATINGEGRRVGEWGASTGDVASGRVSKWLQGFVSSIGENLEVARSGVLDLDITKELVELQRGRTGGISGNARALELAKVYHSAQALVHKTAKSFNPLMGSIEDHFWRQTHSAEKIQVAGKQAWLEKAWDTFGKKSFPELSLEARKARFEKDFDLIVAGKYRSSIVDGEIGGTMERAASGRSFIPESAEKFYEYNKEFGRYGLYESMERLFDTTAKDIAVWEKFGGNPSNAFKRMVKEIEKVHGAEAAKEVSKNWKVKAALEEQTFIQDTPAAGLVSDGISAAKTFAQVTMNGRQVLRSGTDFVLQAWRRSELGENGFLSSMAKNVAQYAKQMGPLGDAGRAEALKLGIAHRSILRDLARRNGADERGIGSKIMQLHSWATFAERDALAKQTGIARYVSLDMASQSHLPHSKLDPVTQRALLRAGIKEAEWNAIRQAKDFIDGPDGDIRAITMGGIENLPDEVFQKYLKDSGQVKSKKAMTEAAVTRARTNLANSFGAFVNEHARTGSSTAGQAQYALMKFGSKKGTPAGQALELFTQFTSATFKNYEVLMQARFRDSNAKYGNWGKPIALAASMMPVFIAQKALLDIASGKTPESPASPQYMFRAMADSGIFGVYGSTLVSALDDAGGMTGQELAANFLGPIPSLAADVGALGYNVGASVLGDAKFPKAQLGRLSKKLNPNIFYTQRALDYLFFDGIRELIDPGSAMKQEKRMMQKEGMFTDRVESIGPFPPPSESLGVR